MLKRGYELTTDIGKASPCELVQQLWLSGSRVHYY
jgi:hypothetical protein